LLLLALTNLVPAVAVLSTFGQLILTSLNGF
jgi:hypothetical protein